MGGPTVYEHGTCDINPKGKGKRKTRRAKAHKTGRSSSKKSKRRTPKKT